MSATDTVRHDRMKSNAMFLPHASVAVSRARRLAQIELTAQGVSELALEDVALVLSELVGNAVQHARPLPGELLEVGWSVSPDGVRLWVTDGGTDRLVEFRRPGGSQDLELSGAAAQLGDSGRGLLIVDSLAQDWGVDDESRTRRTVWALISLPPTLRSVP